MKLFNTKTFESNSKEIRFSDIPKDIKENDIIDIQRHESFYSDNDSYDSFTKLIIIREREETDDEYSKRIKKHEKFKENLKKKRYENYLKLKEEFEDQDTKNFYKSY